MTAHCIAPRALRRVRAGLEYHGVVRELIHRWKFDGAIDLTGFLADLALLAAPVTPRFDALVPVPMHWRRRWYRGYNQSYVLARVLSQALWRQHGIRTPVRNLLTARRRAHAQHEMNRLERSQNAQHRYSTDARLQGQRLLIIDDVVTTGTTLGAIAACLADAGAARIEAWCLARAPQAGTTRSPDSGS